MAAILPVISIIATVAGTVMKFKSQQKADDYKEDAARRQEEAARKSQGIAELNAINSERETAQRLENLKGQTDREEASSRARAAASGFVVTGDGSFGLALSEQETINDEQYAWLKKSGSNEAEIIREQGEYSYETGMAQASMTKSSTGGSGWGTIIGGATKAAGIGSAAGYW